MINYQRGVTIKKHRKIPMHVDQVSKIHLSENSEKIQ